MTAPIRIVPVESARDRDRFVDFAFDLYKGDPNWVPPLKSDVHALISGKPDKNPWYGHGEAAFWLALQGDKVVGRISAQDDTLVREHIAPDLGHFGMFDCIDDAAVSEALLNTAEAWLRARGLSRAQGPISISIWDEPGLLVSGFDRPPAVMMGHHLPWYAKLIEAHGYRGVKDLHAWELNVRTGFNQLITRIVATGERNSRIRIRQFDKSRFDEEAALLLDILNDAWSDNWGFVPLTPLEIAYVGKKMKPMIFSDLVLIAEFDGEPVAFMLTFPNLNQVLKGLNGSLLPFGWAKLLWWLRRPKSRLMRVPLMGVRRTFHGSRNASVMAFMMIEYIRRAGVAVYEADVAEIGWILEDNGPMRSIAEAIDSHITKTYRIYERAL